MINILISIKVQILIMMIRTILFTLNWLKTDENNNFTNIIFIIYIINYLI